MATGAPSRRGKSGSSRGSSQASSGSSRSANSGYRKPKESTWENSSFLRSDGSSSVRGGASGRSRTGSSAGAHSSAKPPRSGAQNRGTGAGRSGGSRTAQAGNGVSSRMAQGRSSQAAPQASRRSASSSSVRSASSGRPSSARNSRGVRESSSFGHEQLSAGIYSKGKGGSSRNGSGRGASGRNGVGGGASGRGGSGRGGSPRKPGFFSNGKVRLVAGLLVVLLAVGLVDTGLNWGKVYPGVSVGDVEVGGMSVEDAQKTIDTTYNKRLFGSDVTICRSDEVLTAVLNGEKVEDLEGEDVSVDEAAAAQQTWKTDAITLQANVNAEELAYEALEVGRSDGGIFKRVGAFLFGNTVSPNLNFNDSAIEELAKDIDKTMGDVRVNYGVKVSDGVAAVTEGHDGNMVSRVWLKRTLNDQFTSADSSHAFVAEISYAPLQIDQEQAQACADTINTALNRGATLTFEGTSYDIDAASLGKWVKTSVNETSDEATPEEEKTYEIVPYLNVDKARSAILKHLTPSMDKEKAQVKIKVSGDTATVAPCPSWQMRWNPSMRPSSKTLRNLLTP